MSREGLRKPVRWASLATPLLVVLASVALWLTVVLVENRLLPRILHDGSDLLLLAPGLRLLLLLVGGGWAAAGITFASLILPGAGGGDAAPWQTILLAVTSGFAPYVSLRLTSRILGVDKNLANLCSMHLPLISLGVALGSSALHAVAFGLSGMVPLPHLPGLALAMASTDFLGCLITVLFVTLGMRLFRRWQRQRM